MKLSNSLAIVAVALMCTAAGTVMAQDGNGGGQGGQGGGRRGGPGGPGGNFDPAQMQQRMMDNLKDQMGVTDDSEWKVIQERLQKVMDARREVGNPGMGRMFRNRGNDNNGGGQRRGGMFGTPSPELEALNTAIDNNAPADQIKTALAKYRAAQKTKEDALEKAQGELKKVLTGKQEAVAVANGLIK